VVTNDEESAAQLLKIVPVLKVSDSPTTVGFCADVLGYTVV
jgi:hypothetical protein